MKNKNFCIFILTHGRPDNVITYRTLKRAGCKYPIYFVVDDGDKASGKYVENFGRDNVVLFNKSKVAEGFDLGDNFENDKVIIYARNVCFDIAERLGYKYFLQLDDDYTVFSFTYNGGGYFQQKAIKNIDKTIDLFLEYYRSINAKTICFIQRGDLIGGGLNYELQSGRYPFIKRKAMNSFFCSVDRRIYFVGRINEDVNTYVSDGSRGVLYMTIPLVSLNQMQTQMNKGGMTGTYLTTGTYIKSFYTVMYHPSSVVVAMMGIRNPRLHHSIKWDNTVPKIIKEGYKK